MLTNRLKFQVIDESYSVGETTAFTGACVVKAPKGTKFPKLVRKGDTNALKDMFGSPNSTYPGLLEAQEYLKTYSLWISAPSSGTSSYGGSYLTKLGSIEPFYNVVENNSGEPNINFLTVVANSNVNSAFAYPTPLFSTTYDISGISYPSTLTSVILTSGSTVVTLSVNGSIIKNGETIVGSLSGAVISIDPTPLSGTITVNGSTTYKLVYNIKDYAIMALYQNSPRAISANITNLTVTSDTLVYPEYSYKFTITRSSSPTSVNVCGVNFSLTGTYSTAEQIVTAVKSVATGKLPSGFTINPSTASNYIIINARKGLLPSITFPSNSATAYLTVEYSVNDTDIDAGSGLFCGKQYITTGGAYSDLLTALQAIMPEGVPGTYITDYENALTFGKVKVQYLPGVTFPTLIYPSGIVATATDPVSGVGTPLANNDVNTLTFSFTEEKYTRAYTMSPDTAKVDSLGNSIYAEDVLEGNPYLGVKVFMNSMTPLTGYIWQKRSFGMLGTRTVTDNDVVSGWTSLANPELQDVNIFFDPECLSAVASEMANLRSSFNSFATYITGIKVSNAFANDSSTIAATVNNITEARATLPNVTGLAYYCNEFLMKEFETGTSFYNVPIGSIASMLTQIMENKLGGVSPMFTNEGNPALGGQLSRSVIKAKYNFDANALDDLNAIGVNPIILDNFYGLMMTSDKTAQSPLNLTDWSYLGHQMAFDLFQKEVKQQVMLPQIGKLIDAQHMRIRREQTQSILNRRLTGATAIWTEGLVQVEEVNTPETKARNEFMIKVRVKVTPFSQFVTLIFNNVAQTSSVTIA